MAALRTAIAGHADYTTALILMYNWYAPGTIHWIGVHKPQPWDA